MASYQICQLIWSFHVLTVPVQLPHLLHFPPTAQTHNRFSCHSTLDLVLKLGINDYPVQGVPRLTCMLISIGYRSHLLPYVLQKTCSQRKAKPDVTEIFSQDRYMILGEIGWIPLNLPASVSHTQTHRHAHTQSKLIAQGTVICSETTML